MPPVMPEQPIQMLPVVENILSGIERVNLCNLKDQNYLLYWVNGNSTFMELDQMENDIRFKGILMANSTMSLDMLPGDRYHLVPYTMNEPPPYHPRTDRQFFIPPYVTLDIKEQVPSVIHIDDGGKLSEKNDWKFKALRMDYLLKQMIKLGGMSYDNMEPILDLHQDIKIPYHSEFEKEQAGIPSTFTNIT